MSDPQARSRPGAVSRRTGVWLALLLCVTLGTAREIHILHYNDFHAHNEPLYTPVDGGAAYDLGGAALLKGLIDSLRAVYHDDSVCHGDLLFNAGDDFQGSPISGFTQGGSQITVMNEMGLDLFCPGNHEFDYGDRNIRDKLAAAEFAVVCCNVTDSAGDLLWPAYHVFETGGLRIGVIGVMTAGLPSLVAKGSLAASRVLDPVPEIRRWYRELAPVTDLQLLLSHSGFLADSAYAAAVPGLDAVIGGHSHTELSAGRRVGETLILQAGCCGNWLGDLTIAVNEVDGAVALSGRLHAVDSRWTTPASGMLRVVVALSEQLPPELSERIGNLQQPWVREFPESNVGDWTADVMRDYARTELAFMNLGGIRRDLPAGAITRLDIWEVHPFGNHYVTFELSGEQLFGFLRALVKGELSESFAFSGLELSINREAGALAGIKVNGESLIMNRTYSAVTNSFIFSHLEELFGLDPARVNAEHLPDLDRDVIIAAVIREQNIEAVNAHRITFH